MQDFFPHLFCLSTPTSFTKYNNTIIYKDDDQNNTVYPSRTYSYLKRQSSVDKWPSLKVFLLMWTVIIYILLSLELSCRGFQVIHEVKYSSTRQPNINSCCHLASYMMIFGETLPVFFTSTVISICQNTCINYQQNTNGTRQDYQSCPANTARVFSHSLSTCCYYSNISIPVNSIYDFFYMYVST